MLLATPKPRMVTRYLGGLSSIDRPGVQMVIWTRNLARRIREELRDLAGIRAVEFIALGVEPFDRVRQQLRKAGIHSHFLSHDIALLVTVFAELARTRRIRVRLEDGITDFEKKSAGDLALLCAYTGPGFRDREKPARQADGQVAILRTLGEPTPRPAGLLLQLDTAS